MINELEFSKQNLEDVLQSILSQYKSSFIAKEYNDENDEHDLLMDVFGISPETKRENRQYWGRELGMCWQLLITEVFKFNCDTFGPALRFNSDEPFDLTAGIYAIDTKYRIGSGDSGTLKKFKAYGPLLIEKGYEPILLILREDNLPAAISACLTGGWKVYTGDETFKFINNLTGFNLKNYLSQKVGDFEVHR